MHRSCKMSLERSIPLINSTQARTVKLIQSTLQFPAPIPVTSTVQSDVIEPAASQAQELVGEYMTWLQSINACERRAYKEALTERWSSFVNPLNQTQLEKIDMLGVIRELSTKELEDFRAAAASKLFEQEICKVFLMTFGGLGFYLHRS